MMGRESNYIPLSLESLRALGNWAADCAEVREVLLQMPARQAGNSRLDKLLYALDVGIRGGLSPIERTA